MGCKQITENMWVVSRSSLRKYVGRKDYNDIITENLRVMPDYMCMNM